MSPDYELWDGLGRRHQFSFVPRADLANELTLPLIVYPPLNHHKFLFENEAFNIGSRSCISDWNKL